ncbi:MAG TPA: DUF5985 family protein [Phycisphaerae bacterium]
MLGANVMAAFVIGLFFLRFWKKSRDRLFVYFSLAFWMMGLNWVALAFSQRDEAQTALYIIRLLAFGIILLGIWDKNRQQPARAGGQTVEHP